MSHNYHSLDTSNKAATALAGANSPPLLGKIEFVPMEECQCASGAGAVVWTKDKEKEGQYTSLGSSSSSTGMNKQRTTDRTNPQDSGDSVGDASITSQDVNRMVHRLKSDVQNLKEFLDLKHQYATIHDSGIVGDYGTKSHQRKQKQKPKQSPRHKAKQVNQRDGEDVSVVRIIENRGLYNVRHVLDPGSSGWRRFFWALLLVLSILLASYHIHALCAKFFHYPTHTSIQERFLDTLDFPAVTICNLNQVRLTELSGAGLYQAYVETTAKQVSFSSNATIMLDSINVTYKAFLDRFGHKQEDFIYRCRWKHEGCTPESFTPIYTDRGRCFTFNPDSWKRTVTEAGQVQSLFLELNVEQYEYVLNTNSAVGARISVHDAGREPSAYTGCLTVPVGKYTSIKIQKIKRQSLPRPYGICDSPLPQGMLFDGLSCLRTCDDVYQEHRYAARSTYTSCHCIKECQRVEYSLTASQAAIPSYGAADLTSSIQQRRRLEDRFNKARDTYHRVDGVIYEYDKNKLNQLYAQVNTCVSLAQTFRQNISRYTESYDIASNNLLNAVDKLRLIVKRNFNFFKQPSHVAFNLFVPQLNTSIYDVSRRLNYTISSKNFLPENVLSNLYQILKTLKYIIGINHDWTVNTPLLAEIFSGVETLRDELVLGYGKQYREFRNSKTFYDSTTKSLLHTLHKLSHKLRESYNMISNVTAKLELKLPIPHKTLRTTLPHLFQRIRYEVSDLMSQLDVLKLKYFSHRLQIMDLYRRLPNITSNVNRTLTNIHNNITAMRNLAKDVEDSLAVLLSESQRVRKRYVGGEYSKSKLAKELLNSRTVMEWKKVKSTLHGFESLSYIIDQIRVSSLDAIKKVSPRIIDFGLLTNDVVIDLIQDLEFVSLHREVAVITTALRAIVDNFDGYIEELRQYINGNRVNTEFYRNNFMHLEIYYEELSETVYTQTPSYSAFDLACDIGGALALYLGASILTLLDLVEAFCKIMAFKVRSS